MQLSDLAKPFPPEKISWRVGSTNADKTKGLALAYIDARDVQDRLNEICEIGNWQCRYPHVGTKTVCEIGILVDHGFGLPEWIWKADGAGDSDVEAEKGALSDAFKRAAVRWGIGRYLYDLDSPWVALEPAGRSFKIAAGEYAKLSAILIKLNHNPPPPPPRITPADWAQQASEAVAEFSTIVGLDAWCKKNEKPVAKLVEDHPALANALITKIDIRRRELTR